MTRVYIYGSCVSRDAFDHQDAPFLAGYVARSPFGSAFSPALDQIPDINLQMNPSAFQQAMVQTDLYKLLPHRLERAEFDFLMVDLIDERLRTVRSAPGYYTYSPEAQRCGMSVDQVPLILPGSQEHMASFKDGLRGLLEIVSPDRIVVNRVFWAEVDVNGKEAAPRESVAENNKILAELYSYFESARGIRFIDYSPEQLVADPDHKWGASPFHYVPAFYQRTVDCLRSLIGADDSVQSKPPSVRKFNSDDLGSELAGRRLQSVLPITFSQGRAVVAGGLARRDYPVHTNGSLTTADEGLVVGFQGGFGVYESTFRLSDEGIRANGFSTRLRLEAWDQIQYIAVGHMHEGQYRHVKVSHIRQGEWLNLSISYNDLAYKIQNGYASPEASNIRDLRIFIKGAPGTNISSLRVAWCAAWMECPEIALEWKRSDKAGAVIALLADYVAGASVDVDEQIREFLHSGRFPMPGGLYLGWPCSEEVPDGLFDSNTFRYIWHSLYFAANLVIYGHKFHDNAATLAGQGMAQSWLEHNFWEESDDRRYAWYDHGSAERLIALLIIRHFGEEFGYDYRTSRGLEVAIEAHTRLLESESFYAANQITRYHNHAWFQDLALIASAACTASGILSERRISKGLARLRDQFAKLIVLEDKYAVFGENSSGYHTSSSLIVRLVGNLEKLVSGSNEFAYLANQLDAWTTYFRYPNGRAPANGDTFRLGNNVESKEPGRKPYDIEEFLVLPQAGYAVVKGNAGASSYMMTFLATSVSSSHKHCDDLSVTLFYDGIEWLVDPSFYSHDYSDATPKYLRGPWAHNGVVIPGLDYSIAPHTSKLRGSRNGGDFSLSGQHAAYTGILVNREVRGRMGDLSLSFSDSATGTTGPNPESVYSVLHLGEGVSADIRANCAHLSHPRSEHVLIVNFPGVAALSIAGSGDSEESTSICGTSFGHQIGSHSILLLHPNPGDVCDWSIALGR